MHDYKTRTEEATAAKDAANKKQKDSQAGFERVQKEKAAIDSVLQTLKSDMVKVCKGSTKKMLHGEKKS